MESGFIIEDGKLIKPVGSVQSIIMIPHNVEVIGEYAFANLHDIEGIVLHDRVEKIGREAFLGCRSLTHIELPDSVQQIGRRIFDRCPGIQKVKLPKNVEIKPWLLNDSKFYRS